MIRRAELLFILRDVLPPDRSLSDDAIQDLLTLIARYPMFVMFAAQDKIERAAALSEISTLRVACVTLIRALNNLSIEAETLLQITSKNDMESGDWRSWDHKVSVCAIDLVDCVWDISKTADMLFRHGSGRPENGAENVFLWNLLHWCERQGYENPRAGDGWFSRLAVVTLEAAGHPPFGNNPESCLRTKARSLSSKLQKLLRVWRTRQEAGTA